MAFFFEKVHLRDTVNINYLGEVGIVSLVVIAGALIFRMLGVFVCLLGTNLNSKERLFSMMAYTPKATVQAAIGGIIITVPLGAFAIDSTYKKLL